MENLKLSQHLIITLVMTRSKDAQLVSNTLNTSHTNLEINYEDYIEENINLVSKTLNPLMMPHEIPLNKLFKEIQSKVKVVLSGEGADEFFGVIQEIKV